MDAFPESSRCVNRGLRSAASSEAENFVLNREAVTARGFNGLGRLENRVELCNRDRDVSQREGTPMLMRTPGTMDGSTRR